MDKLYIKVCEHYKNLILKGQLKPGQKLPSIRKTCEELSVSKTTAENAYFQLTAEGFVMPKDKSGYYITDIVNDKKKNESDSSKTRINRALAEQIKYDFSKVGEDQDAFCFDLWQKYMKSAMRDYDKLLSYGMPQGEYDLRYEISEFVRKRRNIICTPEQIVIGAGTQNLLHVLLPLLKQYKSASVPTIGFKEFAFIFENYGFKVGIRQKDNDIIYVAPAHMTRWGEVMPLKRRHELANHIKNGHFVIEDDYLNELVFSNESTPSIFALSGGTNVAYIGSFSRVLLPSIRISFMILPMDMVEAYNNVKNYMLQTASKTEQIALCSFLRDGHLLRHIKKLRKLYSRKVDLLLDELGKMCEMVNEELKNSDVNLELLKCQSGTEAGVIIRCADVKNNAALLKKRLIDYKTNVLIREEDHILLIFSCSIISENGITDGIECVKNAIVETFDHD